MRSSLNTAELGVCSMCGQQWGPRLKRWARQCPPPCNGRLTRINGWGDVMEDAPSVTEQLHELLIAAFPDWTVEVPSVCRGYWTSVQQDVMQVQVVLQQGKLQAECNSWDTASELVRSGFTIHDCRELDPWFRDGDFMLEAKRKRPRAM